MNFLHFHSSLVEGDEGKPGKLCCQFLLSFFMQIFGEGGRSEDKEGDYNL